MGLGDYLSYYLGILLGTPYNSDAVCDEVVKRYIKDLLSGRGSIYLKEADFLSGKVAEGFFMGWIDREAKKFICLDGACFAP